MKNLFVSLMLFSSSVLANAQSIQSQAEKAGNEAFANAMFRNVFIIIGVVLFFYLSGSKKNKDDKKV